MSALELHEVFKTYGDGPAAVHALRDVTLTVDEGELVAVMGPSGSGKTTLLTIAGGLEDPTSGEVVVAGDKLSTRSRGQKARLRRRSVGYVFQDYNLLAGLSALENVSLPLELDGVPARRAQTMAQAALEVFDVADKGQNFPDELSGGERQRVAIARALAAEPDVLVCDEITSALDASVQAAIVELLEELRERDGVSLLFVTHNLALVRTIADRVAVLEHGTLVEAGTTIRVLDEPEAEYTKRLLADTPSLSAG